MLGKAKSILERLCEAGSPHDLMDWEGRDGYYVAACRVSASDAPELIEIARKYVDLDWLSNTDLPGIDSDGAGLLPVTAWRVLADLKAEAAVEPLIQLLRELDDEFDDWPAEELPHVFGKIGPSAIEPLAQLGKDQGVASFIRTIAACGLRCAADYHPETRDRVVSHLVDMLKQARAEEIDFNSTVLVELVELRAVEASELIERAFADNLIDVGMMGDWETVRSRLGVEGLGLPMPPHPYSSLERFRTRLGRGIFSDWLLSDAGEMDADAAQAYFQRAFEGFSNSPEAQECVDRFGDLNWAQALLDFGLQYRAEIVDAMTVESVAEFVFDFVPRKVSVEAERAAEILCELTMYWRYLDRVHELPQAKSIIEWLAADAQTGELEAALSDPSNFDLAKSMFMMGSEAGYDMTSEAGLEEFVRDYEQSLNREPLPAVAEPITRGPRVGRNDPCPCGSGKKFKKCCHLKAP